jgi:tRNA (cytidine/uridine-2'-O-)-methyltransferase
MDYWPRVKLTVHDDVPAFWNAVGTARVWLFSTKGNRGLWQADFRDHDWLIFGSETAGLPQRLLDDRADQVIRIPQVESERCLNLSTAAGIGLYEALRQVATPTT